MKAKRGLGTFAVAAAIFATGAAFAAQGPAQINYQGVLRDAAGKPRTGSFDMVFRFYDALLAGNEILVDSHEVAGTGAVTATSGAFNVALGGGTVTDGSGPNTYVSLRDVFAQFGTVYLEVTVGGETLSPRTRLLSSAFAIASHGPDGPCFDNANRFVDCGNGTVTDTVSGMIWLKNAGCYPATTFTDANNAATALHTGQCGLTDGSTAGDWRLPSVSEWTTIVKASCFVQDSNLPTIPDRLGTGCFGANNGWATGVLADFYWTSTTDSSATPDNGSLADLLRGFSQNGDLKTSPFYYVWPVRRGK